jgi:D-glycero-alpha-D-manno-heptose-7-phosphate kinase
MIITRTPLRISFFGGGSDFPEYFEQDGCEGIVLSTAIDKFIYVMLNPKYDDKVRVSYSVTENVDHVSELKHDLIREALKMYGIESGVEIVTVADIPSEGTGLGSSSSVLVGVLTALCEYTEGWNPCKREKIYQQACEIERDILGKPIGYQDQAIAVWGKTRKFTFTKDSLKRDTVHRQGIITELNECLLMFDSGITRKSSSVLSEQKGDIAKNGRVLDELIKIAQEEFYCLEQGSLTDFGDKLDNAWDLKRMLAHSITSPHIDAMYALARLNGATGGKICGAGGGGFMLLYCPKGTRDTVRAAMSEHYKELPIVINQEGSKIIWRS